MELGLAPSRSRAQALILAGKVRIDGKPASKAGQAVPSGADIQLTQPDHPYVSRGGLKLAGALDNFSLNVSDWECLDAGASTGGFCDCLLQRGAKAVTCVDVGYGQLAWKLRQDSRVTLHERLNLRHLPPDIASGPFDLIVADLSFISLTLVLPVLAPRLASGGHLLPMVKPQFEAGPEAVGPGGVVRDENVRRQAVEKISGCLEDLGLTVLGSCPSPITGPKGNQEYFVLAKKPAHDV